MVNPRHARQLLEAVRAQEPGGERLAVFFALMYYAALRPEEAISLQRSDVTLPDLGWNDENEAWEEPADDWGELHFRAPTPDAGREWTDDGSHREQRRQLTDPTTRNGASRVRRRSPLAKRPYDLRHACVSTWLNGGVPPTKVAEWAGHSVDVLLRICASSLEGLDKAPDTRLFTGVRGGELPTITYRRAWRNAR